MKRAILLVALASTSVLVNAECPSSCSGHGTCGQNDQCTCYQGHRGNACEQRVCPYGKAWTTTPNGDLNFDGNLVTSSTYNGVTKFTSRSHIVTMENAGGSWEFWPATAQNDEGHFQMECSNMGLCNKELGECLCFPGFEGSACERMSCPGGNDCNGHGRCMTLQQIVDEDTNKEGGSITYSLWDKDMSRRCVCDPGFSGIDCMERVCPVGDDPLTKVHQTDEVQTIDIFSTVVTSLGGDIGGSFTLTYKTPSGERYTTDDITLPSSFDGSTAATTTLPAAVESALAALPNGVVPSVTVTTGYCEELIPGELTTDFATNPDYARGKTATFARCPGLVLTGSCEHLIFTPDVDDNTGGSGPYTLGADSGTCAGQAALTAAAITFPSMLSGCTQLTYNRCMRLYVKFSDPANSGPQNLLEVDTTKVTLNGKTMAQDNTVGVNKMVTKTPTLAMATASFGYVPASTVSVVDATTATAKVAVDGITITIDAGATALPASASIFPIDSSIQIWCQDSSASSYSDMGTYTVSATTAELSAAGGTIVLNEVMNDPSGKCTDAGDFIKVQLLTDYINTDVDLAHTAIATLGSGVSLGGTEITSSIKSSSYIATVDNLTPPRGYALLTETPVGVAQIAPAAALDRFKLSGTGTKEADICSSRGNCDSETGACKCFKGYTGERCDTQNALWIGGA